MNNPSPKGLAPSARAVCSRCGREFRAPHHAARHEAFCFTPPTLERLREIGGVSVDAPPTECWEWRDATSYGHLGGKRVHIRALELAQGRPIKRGYYACHRCNNPKCFNPSHIYEGRPKDNSADMLRRFGAPQGSYGMSTDERSARMRGAAGQKARAARWERDAIPRTTAKCKKCGTEFETPVSGARVRKFCSVECVKTRWRVD